MGFTVMSNRTLVEFLLVVDADDLDDLSGSARPPLGITFENIDLLLGRGPFGQGFQVVQHVQDLSGCRLDEDLARFGDGHAAT